MTIVAPRTNDGNPTVIMLLDEFGNNDAPMYAVLSFYSNKPINGSNTIKPHVVLTIAEREWRAKDGRTGYDEIIKSAIEENRVISFDKNKRDDLTEVAQTTSLGNITVSSLNHNLSQFKKEINSFKAHKTKITEASLSRVDNNRPSSEETSAKGRIAQSKNKVKQQSRSDADYLSAVERGEMEGRKADQSISTCR